MTTTPIPRANAPRLAAAATVLAALIATSNAGADDWPQWRGPHRDGRSAETGLLPAWPEGGPPVVWKSSGLGAGYSSLSVAEGRIYTLGDLEDGQYVFALDEETGEMRWKTRVGNIHEDRYGGPRSTPTVDGSRLYVMTTDGSVVCLEAADGEEVWRRSLPDDFEGYLMRAMGSYDWRWAESPLVDGDRVIVTPGHIAAFLVALDKKTGEEIWRTQGGRIGPRGSDGAAYSSVVVSEAAGVKQYVQLLGRGLIGVEASSGKLLWSYNLASDIANIATPIVDGDHVFGSVGYGTGSVLLRIRERAEPGDEREPYEAEEVYFLEADTLQNHHGGLILDGGVIFTGTGHNKGFPIAVELASGKVLWGPVRNAGSDSAAVTYADGRLYFRYQNGVMILVEATPEGYRQHGSFTIPNVVKQSWAHPVVANGRLLLREQETLYSYDVTAPSASPGS